MRSSLVFLRFAIERGLVLWLVLLCVLAYGWSEWFSPGTDPFLLGRPGLNYLFAVTMFAVGSLLPRDEIERVLRRWPTIFSGTAVQFTAMPFLATVAAVLSGLPRELAVGVVLVGAVPGAMASNVLTLVARGNVSYSVSLTTSATLLSPIVTPTVLWLVLRRWVHFPVLKTSWMLCWMVVLPVLLGHLLSRRWNRWRQVAELVAPIVANLAILWIIATVVAANREKLQLFRSDLYLVLLAVNLGGYSAGWLAGRALGLPDSMRRALMLEIGMQNAGLGTVVAMDVFAELPAAAIPPAVYTFGCMFTGTILARILATRPTSDVESLLPDQKAA